MVEGDFSGDSEASMRPNPWRLSSVTRVEEVKMVVRLLPVWATTILFWTTYAQMMTFSVEQASTMERTIRRFLIPAGSMTAFFVAGIWITLAVYDRLIMHFWKKWKGKQGRTSIYILNYSATLSLSLFPRTLNGVRLRRQWDYLTMQVSPTYKEWG